MITTTSYPELEKSANLGVQKSFTIKASAKAFQILSSGLYSNKILAVIRETFCNAMDSHAAAGKKDTPVTVHLPNQFEPFFSIKDEGTGLSHEDIMTLYTTYFESTKTQSNDYTGMLGLGSKSIFSYSDSFTVISRFNSVKSVYNCHISEEGMPSVIRLSEEETDECNGLEVSANVQQSDFHSFKHNLEQFLKYVKVAPKVVGMSNFTVQYPSYVAQGEKDGVIWKMRQDERSSGIGAKAIMGNVAYSLSDIDKKQYSETEIRLLETPIDLFFPIGSLDVAASRENLSFDPQTTKAFKEALSFIIAQIRTKVEEAFTDCKNEWAAKILLDKLKHKELRNLYHVIKGLGVSFKGKIVNENIYKVTAPIECKYYHSKRKGVSCSSINQIQATDSFRFYMNDLDEAADKRARIAYKSAAKEVIVFTLNGVTEEDFLKTIGKEGEPFEKLSSIPKPERKKSTISEKGKAGILELQLTSNYYDAATFWEVPDEDFDESEGGLYVDVKSYLINGQTKPEYFIQTFLKNLGLFDIKIDQPIYGIKKRKKDSVLKNPKWKCLTTHLKELLADKMKEEGLWDKIYNAQKYQGFDSFDTSVGRKIFRFVDNTWKGPLFPFKQKVETVKKEVNKSLFTMSEVLSVFEIKNKKAEKSFNTEYGEIISRYPLMESVSVYHSIDDKIPALKEYVNAIETVKSIEKK